MVIMIFGIPGSFVPAINWSTCNVLDVHTSAAGVCTQLSWHVQPGATSVTKMLTLYTVRVVAKLCCWRACKLGTCGAHTCVPNCSNLHRRILHTESHMVWCRLLHAFLCITFCTPPFHNTAAVQSSK